MKMLKKLQINPERLIEKEELVTFRGGYDVNFCGEGIDRWTCSVYDPLYGNRYAASFCVPSGCNPDTAEDYVQEQFQYLSVLYCI